MRIYLLATFVLLQLGHTSVGAASFVDRGPFDLQIRHAGYTRFEDIKVSKRFQNRMLEYTRLWLPPVGGFIEENQKRYMQSYLQRYENMVGVYLSTQDLEERGLYTPVRGGGPNVAYSNDYTTIELFPFRNSESFTLEADVGVPAIEQIAPDGRVYPGGGLPADQAPLAQVSFIIYLRDVTHPESVVAFVVVMYDSFRITEEWLGNDTFTYFMSTNVKGPRYVTPLASGAAPQTKPFQGQTHFGFGMTRTNLKNVITDLGAKLKLSRNPDDYRLTIAGVLVELPNYVKGGHTNFGAYIMNMVLTTGVTLPEEPPTASFYINDIRNAKLEVRKGQGFRLRFESANADSCTLTSFVNGQRWHENKDFKTNHDWGTVVLNGSGLYRWEIDCPNKITGLNAQSFAEVTVK